MSATVPELLRKELVRIVDDAIEEANIMQCCITCKSFDEPSELCRLCNPPSRPPARVITFGCAAYDRREE